MPYLDHVAIWVADLDSARDFYSHWFDGHANGLYENPRTGLRTHILHFAETPAGERGTRLEIRPVRSWPRGVRPPGWGGLTSLLACRGAKTSTAWLPTCRKPVCRSSTDLARPATGTTRPPCLTPRATASSSLPPTTPTTSPCARPSDPDLLIRKARPGSQPGHAVREWCAPLRC